MAKWMFLLTDLQGAVKGEIMNADKRQVILPFKDTPTMSFSVQSTNALANYFIDPTFDGLIKGYRDTALRFHGQIVSGQEVGDNTGASAIVVNASGPFWRLNYRTVGNPASSGGVVVPVSYGGPGGPVDLSLIAHNLIDAANTQGYTGITRNTLTASTTGAAGPYIIQPIGDAIKTLSVAAGSFDWEVVPTEPTNVGQAWPQIGLFNAVPSIGNAASNVVFEYGTGMANVQAYGNTVDRSGLCNTGYMEQPAVTDYTDVLIQTDAPSIAARGVYAALVDNAGLQYDNFRTPLLTQNITIRRQPRQILTFQPRPNANFQPFVDYNLGDQVRCRVVSNGSLRFDAIMRVFGIQIDLDNNGNETPTLQLTPP